MRLHRFYIQKNLQIGNQLETFDATHLHQWLSVFRYTTGDRVILFNGNGNEYEAKFNELHKKQAILDILSEKESVMPQKNGVEVHVYLAVIKKDLFELAVEKCIELGVSSITPILTERTQDKNLNMDRLKRIAIEASEQSGRGDVGEVKTTVSLQNALEHANGYTVYIADLNHTGDKFSIKKGSKSPRALFIGPEGGWGAKDLEILKNYHTETISLGETVLRAETAAIVGSFMLMHQ